MSTLFVRSSKLLFLFVLAIGFALTTVSSALAGTPKFEVSASTFTEGTEPVGIGDGSEQENKRVKARVDRKRKRTYRRIMRRAFRFIRTDSLDDCAFIYYRDDRFHRGEIVMVTKTHVHYKRCDAPDGPVVIAAKEELRQIVEPNGKTMHFQKGATDNFGKRRRVAGAITLIFSLLTLVMLSLAIMQGATILPALICLFVAVLAGIVYKGNQVKARTIYLLVAIFGVILIAAG